MRLLGGEVLEVMLISIQRKVAPCGQRSQRFGVRPELGSLLYRQPPESLRGDNMIKQYLRWWCGGWTREATRVQTSFLGKERKRYHSHFSGEERPRDLGLPGSPSREWTSRGQRPGLAR